ncbi:MAG: hypothetical protein AAGJ35_04770, partial [Myxococcota bacterium]
VCDPTCQKEQDCPSGQSCQFTVIGQNVVSQCVKPTPNSKKTGDSCDPSRFDAECASNLCGFASKICLKSCLKNDNCDSKQVCEQAFIQIRANQFISVQACLPNTGTCTTPNDCKNNTICGVSESKNPLYACFSPDQQALPTGGTCDPKKAFPGDCQSRLCDPESKTCTTPCTQDSDCTDQVRTRCGNLDVKGTPFKACIQPPSQNP